MTGDAFLRRRCRREAQVKVTVFGRELAQRPHGYKVFQSALAFKGDDRNRPCTQRGKISFMKSIIGWLQQLGLTVPAYPVLILTGALRVGGRHSVYALLVTAAGLLVADRLWYWAGHRFGSRVPKKLCRISLSPDSCVRQTESI